jgi:uncharacterized membrane protein
MNIKNQALLTAIISVVILTAISFGIVAFIERFPLATGLFIFGTAAFLFGRSIYLKALERYSEYSEDAESKEA